MRKISWRSVVRLLPAFAVIAYVLPVAPAFSADPLVDVEWVNANVGNAGVVILDTRINAKYKNNHIPGAVWTDYRKDGWRGRGKNVSGVFPADPGKLAERIGALGIGNDSHVVIVANGVTSADMAVATRIYWSLKVLGHDAVSVLNGGMKAYQPKSTGTPVNPLEQGEVTPTAKVFKFTLHSGLLSDEAEVKALLDSGGVLVDNRTHDKFVGVNRDPGSKAAGTIPGAVNLPHTWLTVNAGGLFRNEATLRKLYSVAGVPINERQISFGTTGDLATLGWFVSSEILGNKLAKVYDGSMTAWIASGLPVDQMIQVND